MNHDIFCNLPGKPSGTSQSFSSLITTGAKKYERRIHLQHLLPVSDMMVDDPSHKNCLWILRKLRTALRHERTRGRHSHWAYSLNRHIAVLQAYRGEQDLLERAPSFDRVD